MPSQRHPGARGDLPRLVVAEDAKALSDERSIAAHSDGETILLVDDEEDVRTSKAQLLRGLSYRVLVAPDARAALEVMEMESGSTGLLEQPREGPGT